MLVDVTQAFIRETNGSICVVYNPARSLSHGINLPDFEGQYTSMPCDGPSCWEGFYSFFLKRLERSIALERLELTDPHLELSAAIEPFDRTQGRLIGTIGTSGMRFV
jgi:hypothetical protein